MVHCKVDTFNCPNGTSYGETGQLVYEKDIRKMCDLTTDVMRNPTFTWKLAVRSGSRFLIFYSCEISWDFFLLFLGNDDSLELSKKNVK